MEVFSLKTSSQCSVSEIWDGNSLFLLPFLAVGLLKMPLFKNHWKLTTLGDIRIFMFLWKKCVFKNTYFS